ncbi:hypothetical protein CAOG_07348 [Capsaspora owczarzaki ATCC 30864]|uniref:26S proteasome complex subunit DSS1 n=1 Tax=Capsaspora owczarzaki (strain ATCC 30864) TaxID=595528 RepID=A0A0D2WWT7_CAPO3|nr:hypothetical protein CAOG_07348 [Capsaspora owczarzaki ATCC 30864]KJE97500.1 hypothetical protein CAOG_007348 [Capsaspora owczarzaki ATCC 30864]|eukprot:XP_004343207.1 hypothetical protein CAOG_07348 [Capsaspora owczarzaki ATCC 30864]
MSSAATASKDAKQEPATANVDLLEEDDEFEEFPQEEWNGSAEDKTDQQLWEDNWDDDAAEDDFAKQLRAELSQSTAMAQ